MIVYADLLVGLNSILNYLLLSAAGRFAAMHGKLWRRLLAALLGGFYALVCTLPGLALLGSLPGQLVMAALMLLVSFGFGRQLPSLGFWLLVLSAAYAGVVLLLSKLFHSGLLLLGGSVVYPVRARALVLAAGSCYALTSTVLERLGRSPSEQIVPATICVRGRCLHLRALLDTGNGLRDSVSGEPVCILDPEAARKILPELKDLSLSDPTLVFQALSAALPGVRLLPYQAVGVSAGMLVAFRSDYLVLANRVLRKQYLALSPNRLSGGRYELIAGGDLGWYCR
ncbi:MAG: sigma-E processing peptidase SpoIIGA [Oscillospiraceae bacterium]|nr:sigma-E processing peptidase SpoIIGA [Oscillospiraceae bacterium]